VYDDVLVPTDGSDAATAAVEHALGFATRYGATLHALYVVDASAFAALDADASGVVAGLERRGEAALDRVVETAREADVPVEPATVEGAPAGAIVRYAESAGVDLVVMATHGRTGIDRYLLGSVTEQVVRSSPAPVLTVRVSDEWDGTSAEAEAEEIRLDES
jgi:nucleotide-binding universal stress UspA family protein